MKIVILFLIFSISMPVLADENMLTSSDLLIAQRWLLLGC